MIWNIFRADLRAVVRQFFAFVIVLAVCILPALYAWFNIYANWDPYGGTGNIAIAVASRDAGYRSPEGEAVNKAEEVMDTLRESRSIRWEFPASPEEAIEGAKRGDYYAAIIFSEDFTARMYDLSSALSADEPALTYYENGKKNAVASALTIQATGTSAEIKAGSSKKISLKVMTLSNSKQKVNDVLGNPVEIAVAVMWKVTDTAKAVFAVDNFKEYLSLQCDSAVRNVVKLYPYDITENVDTTGDGKADDGSLRGSTEVVANRIKDEIQSKVSDAGLEIVDARITYLAYAPEIAAAMLQRQQASAVVDARKLIVDGAVGMVEMALERLNEKQMVQLDEERKAAMVSNLLVVLCGNHDAQPIVNSGSLY